MAQAGYRWHLTLALAVVLVALSLRAAPSLSAQEATPQTPPARDDRARLPYLPPETTGAGARTRAAGPPRLDYWGRIAFQSLRDGNWEVYLWRGDAGEIRLTANTHPDLEPRLNPDSTLIAFAGKPSRGYQLMTVNAEGSRFRALTGSEADYLAPSWSPDGTRIALQSNRDGQVEVYVIQADGGNLTRVTANPAYDGDPAWSPDGRTIAFVSNRTGSYAIWTMSPDGTQFEQLAAQPYCEHPAWSPDGQQIAYDADADGDGWQEVWLMNADGSHQRQAYDPGAGDVDAWVGSWSPDGRYVAITRIEFVWYQGQWYWTRSQIQGWDISSTAVYRLTNADTDWYPDWKTVDSWPPTAHLTRLPAQSPAPFAVRWSGTDRGPSGVAVYDVQVKEGPTGAWTDWIMGTDETTGSYAGHGGLTYSFRVRARDRANNQGGWSPEGEAVTTVEALPPVAWLSSLPAFTRQCAPLSWDGRDAGGSGIRAFYWQARRSDSSDWGPVHDGSAPGGATACLWPGYTYYLRVVAVDNADNQSLWPEDPRNAFTTVYNWAVRGKLLDIMETPVLGAVAQTEPGAFLSLPSNEEGEYVAYEASQGERCVLTWSKPGFVSPPPLSFSGWGWNDVTVDATLTPAIELVRGGDFEHDSLAAAGWQATGSVVPRIMTSPHTGTRAVMFGERSFSEPSDVTGSEDDASEPQSALDQAGNVHAVWRQQVDATNHTLYYAVHRRGGAWAEVTRLSPETGESRQATLALGAAGQPRLAWSYGVGDAADIWYRQREGDSTWAEAFNVSHSASDSTAPQMRTDAQDGVHLVWEENVEAGTQVFYSQRTADGAWSAPVRISNERSQAQKPQLAVDARGGLHAVWQDQLDGGHVWYVGRAPGGAWSTPTSLASGARSPVGWDDMLRLTVDGAGAAHVLWLSPAGGTLWYVRRDPGGAWSNPHSVAAAASDRVPSIAVDSGGTLHVLWQGAGRLLYARRSPDGTWSAVEDVWANPYTEYLGAEAQLAVDRQGTVHCVWPFEGQRIYYACRKADGTWSRPEDVSGSAGWSTLPQLYVDPTGWIHVVWLGYPRLRYAGCSLPAQAGRSSIAQRVQVPTGMVEPILSFFYQSDPFIPGLSSAFEVLVEHGAAATSVFSTSTAVGNWTHRWLDMSAWRGQTITLTFELRLAAGMPSARALLDDVSFGPVYPDLWVKPVGRGSALPGGQAVLHLGYGNRGGVPAAGVVVSATLPAGLAYVVADPPPHSDGPILVWNVGDLPAHSSAGAITLTLGVDPTVSLFSRPSVAFNVSTTTPEIDVTNNTDAAEVWVGKYLFLPLLRKE